MVRALCDRVRRPGIKQILVGLSLMAPAGLSTIRGSGESVALNSSAAPIRLAPVEVVATASPENGHSVADASVLAKEFRISVSLAKDIHEAAIEAGVPPRTAFGLVRAESSFRPAAISPVGAIGLTQLMPATARWLEPGVTRQALKRPDTNLRVGFKYLKQLIDRYDGDEKLALTAFNRGPGTVDKLLKRGRNPDNGYAEKVLTGKSARHVALMNRKFGRRS
jgi:soluble lytic murein transglycosylase-like protein